jgi:PAS domain S-box-containing protein
MDRIEIALIYNASLLLALGVVYEISYLLPVKWKKVAPVFNGIVIGLINVLVMSFPYVLEPGITFDTRSIMISVAALTFGAVPGAIAAGMALIYRIVFIGGAGTLTGCSVIVASFLIGLIWRKKIKTQNVKYRCIYLYLMGISVHVVMLLCMVFMPDPVRVLQEISLPVMVIYPIVTVLLGTLLLRQRQKDEDLIKLAEAESRYRSLFHNNHAVMLLINPGNGRIVEANPAASQFYGWDHDTLIRMNISQINTLGKDDINTEISKAISEERNHFNFKHRKASGDVVDVETFSGPITVGGQTLLYSIVHDISERAASQKALEESENRFRLLVETAPDCIYISVDMKLVFANRAAVRLLGAKNAAELIGRPIMNHIHPGYRDIVKQRADRVVYLGENASPLEEIFLRLDGTPVYVEVSSVPMQYQQSAAMLVFVRDTTERKRVESLRTEMEAQQRQQQKLEAIGTLAGGVAHEINNPIHGIMNYAELIRDGLDEAEPRSVYAKEIIRETDRIAVIVKNLLQFSRHEKQTHSYASVYDIVGQTVSLINTVIKKDQIKLDIDIEEGLPDIKCRSQQIQQVLMNLLTNARDALNDKYPDYDENKVIGLDCRLFERDERRWVRITVEDKGCGIPDDVRERMFEPFFSTKPKDKGTGLGLSISFGIVKDHHGKIDIETEPGEYTRFILELPVDNGWQL